MTTARRRLAVAGDYLRGVVYRSPTPALGEEPVPVVVSEDCVATVTVLGRAEAKARVT